MKNALIPNPYQGLWRSIGYNRVLDIGADGYAIYTATAAAACLCERGSAREFGEAFDRTEIDADGRLSLFHAHDLTRYGFERLQAWDPGCRVHLETSEDSATNFRGFCEVFAENYAFFPLRGVDWPATCSAARRRLGATPTLDAVLDELERMITPLADLHVYVSTPARKIRSLQAGRGPRQALQSAFGLATPMLSARSSIDTIGARVRHTVLRDFAPTLERFRQAGNEVVAWGTLCPGVGYLSLLRMFGFAANEAARNASDLPHPTKEVGPFMGADMQALERILDDAIAELADHNALIIDVRLNGGGFDRAGILLCERLIDTPRPVYVKKARCRSGFTEPQTMTLMPARGPRFSKPVFLLTSALTVSAGEVFALAMSALPNVTLLGEATQGVLSDNLFHRLPCGWEVSLSNEVYESLNGLCYEADGVPPDMRLPALAGADLIEELSAGLRIAAERASAA